MTETPLTKSTPAQELCSAEVPTRKRGAYVWGRMSILGDKVVPMSRCGGSVSNP